MLVLVGWQSQTSANYLSKGAFKLGVKDSSIKSPNTQASHLEPKPIYHKDFMLSLTFT